MLSDRSAGLGLNGSGISVCHARIEALRAELSALDLGWLAPAEFQELAGFQAHTRRDAWLCGRLLSKRLVGNHCGIGAEEIEILSRDGKGRGIVPSVKIAGTAVPWHLSISHSVRGVLAALSADPGRRIGVDLVSPEDVCVSSIGVWFTAFERDAGWLADARQAAICWAAKEASYKASNAGESFAPHRYEVVPQTEQLCVRFDGIAEPIPVQVWEVGGDLAALAIVET